jgi:hypothetical protein
MRGSVKDYTIITSPSHKAFYSLRGKQSKLLAVVSCLGAYILSFGRRYVVDSIGVVEMCCYILREHKCILFKE